MIAHPVLLSAARADAWRAHLRLRCHPTSPASCNVADVIALVADHYELSRVDLIGEARVAHIARARHIAMWLARRATGRSLPVIGRIFGRDHSTVVHGVSRIEELRESDVGIRTATDALLAMLTERRPG